MRQRAPATRSGRSGASRHISYGCAQYSRRRRPGRPSEPARCRARSVGRVATRWNSRRAGPTTPCSTWNRRRREAQFGQRLRRLGAGEQDLGAGGDQTSQHLRAGGARSSSDARSSSATTGQSPAPSAWSRPAPGRRPARSASPGRATRPRGPGRPAKPSRQSARCGPTRGVAGWRVAVAGQQQGVGQRQLVAPPARLEVQRGRAQLGQQVARLRPRRSGCQPAPGRPARMRVIASPPRPARAPRRRAAAARAPALSSGVALLQGAGVAAPQRQELRFHVEQAPVEVAAAVLGAAADQLVAAGLEASPPRARAQLAKLGAGAPSSRASQRSPPWRRPGRARLGRSRVAATRRRPPAPSRRCGPGRRGRGRGRCGRRPAGAWPRAGWSCRRRWRR